MMVGMGYLVIVHVDTIDDARALRKDVQDVTDTGRVVGVFRMPPRSETVCAGLSGCKATGWKRLFPEGHMVHACGYRNRDYRERLAGHAGGLLDIYGINLMPREHTPALFRNPEGWDRRKGVVKPENRAVDY